MKVYCPHCHLEQDVPQPKPGQGVQCPGCFRVSVPCAATEVTAPANQADSPCSKPPQSEKSTQCSARKTASMVATVMGVCSVISAAILGPMPGWINSLTYAFFLSVLLGGLLAYGFGIGAIVLAVRAVKRAGSQASFRVRMGGILGFVGIVTYSLTWGGICWLGCICGIISQLFNA